MQWPALLTQSLVAGVRSLGHCALKLQHSLSTIEGDVEKIIHGCTGMADREFSAEIFSCLVLLHNHLIPLHKQDLQLVDTHLH